MIFLLFIQVEILNVIRFPDAQVSIYCLFVCQMGVRMGKHEILMLK